MLTEQDLARIWAALASQVQKHFRITEASRLFQEAGLLVASGGYWAPMLSAANDAFAGFNREEKLRSIVILSQSLSASNAEVAASVAALLRLHGFEYVNNTFVPIGFLDEREALFLPEACSNDMSKSLSRLLNGDLDGALTAACGAVDTIASEAYRTKHLGNPGSDSFQQKVAKVLSAFGRIEELKNDLVALGWDEGDARILCENLRKALNQVAYVMQSLRARMSDAHGSKPALRAVVYDSLKVASILLSLMK